MTNNLKQQIEKLWYKDGHMNINQRDFIIELLTKLKPKYCIETGFATGRSSVSILESAKPTKLISIDIDLDYMGARNHADLLLDKYPNYDIIEGNSKEILTKDFFDTNFSEGIDFAFIDGDHTYNGAINDMEKIYRHINKGGIMVVDDYYSGSPDGCSIPDVNRAVNNFCSNHNIKVEKWNKNGKGFAIIKK